MRTEFPCCSRMPECIRAVAAPVDNALCLLRHTVPDAAEAAALLFEASMLIDADWPPAGLLRFIRCEAVAGGWQQCEVEAALLEATRRRLARLDHTFARRRAVALRARPAASRAFRARIET